MPSLSDELADRLDAIRAAAQAKNSKDHPERRLINAVAARIAAAIVEIRAVSR